MPEFITTDGHTQRVIPLRVKPHEYKIVPTVTGQEFLYGHYSMNYRLPGGDSIRLIANHDQSTAQIILITQDPKLLKLLPGRRSSSLVADIISLLESYKLRASSYPKPLKPEQKQKVACAHKGIEALNPLLEIERGLDPEDHEGQEDLRREVQAIISSCRGESRLIANSPTVSEGVLGTLLYEAQQTTQHYQFNHYYPVSPQDQMDFSPIKEAEKDSFFVWDSELHIGHNPDALDNAIRVICHHYKLKPPQELSHIAANRFEQLFSFIRKLWKDGKEWWHYLALKEKPSHKTHTTRIKDLSVSKITPYFALKGLEQAGYSSLDDLVFNLTQNKIAPIEAKSIKSARQKISSLANDYWAIVSSAQKIVLRHNNELIIIQYFQEDGLYYPLPEGQDLYDLAKVSEKHLFFFERFSLQLHGFLAGIPLFFTNLWSSVTNFIVHELSEEFINHVHAGHNRPEPLACDEPDQQEHNTALHQLLEEQGLLEKGQNIQDFIKKSLEHSAYVIARPQHPPAPPPYINPVHKVFGILRHLADFFIEATDRDPILGTFALAAYLYGGAAVLAPQQLAQLLTKLHMKGLISGIKPVQDIGRLMNHGKFSEALSAAVVCWQGMIVGGNLDKFVVSAITALKDDPAEVAIITTLALSLGYGMTKAIPVLEEEMGSVPWPNYLALGVKGGAAIYDTIIHPGDDWLLGTFKWLCKIVLNLTKFCFAPFFEAYHYGYEDGFLKGWKKSLGLGMNLGKQFIAASLDFGLQLCTVPFLEMSGLLLVMPFKGGTHLTRKILATLGNFKELGSSLRTVAEQNMTTDFIYQFELSPLYGFDSPFGEFSKYGLINAAMNLINFLVLPPLQLIKNLVILPVIDLLSLTIHLAVTFINPLFCAPTWVIGFCLQQFGKAWDPTLGLLFHYSAVGITHTGNFIDTCFSFIKQQALSFIEIQRSALYTWAFSEEGRAVHQELDDSEYCSLRRYEHIPHPADKCIVNALSHHPPLFQRASQGESASPHQQSLRPPTLR